MRYWWVNQNQTFGHEFAGGYLWSPKRTTSGRRNPFYDAMREASPGDLVFGCADTRIKAFGITTSYAYENPLPASSATSAATGNRSAGGSTCSGSRC